MFIILGWVGGISSAIFYVYPMILCSQLLFYGKIGRLIITALTILNIIALFLIEHYFPEIITPYSDETVRFWDAIITLICATIYVAIVNSLLIKDFRFERQRGESLLNNILPESIAAALKKTHKEIIAEEFNDVSILFIDIVNFTSFSSNIKPKELIIILNTVFSCLDSIMEKHGLEKIKTLGDAYMAASGVPIPEKNHLENTINSALDFLKQKDTLDLLPLRQLEVRIGIHCGPVVAGVIGQKKFSYDIWGDTVNMASRMESQGIKNKIQVSEQVFTKMKDKYKFEKRGQIDIKGKGKVTTYIMAV